MVPRNQSSNVSKKSTPPRRCTRNFVEENKILSDAKFCDPGIPLKQYKWFSSPSYDNFGVQKQRQNPMRKTDAKKVPESSAPRYFDLAKPKNYAKIRERVLSKIDVKVSDEVKFDLSVPWPSPPPELVSKSFFKRKRRFLSSWKKHMKLRNTKPNVKKGTLNLRNRFSQKKKK